MTTVVDGGPKRSSKLPLLIILAGILIAGCGLFFTVVASAQEVVGFLHPAATQTLTPTRTLTFTPTLIVVFNPTWTATYTPSPTPTFTLTPTPWPTDTPLPSPTDTPQPTTIPQVSGYLATQGSPWLAYVNATKISEQGANCDCSFALDSCKHFKTQSIAQACYDHCKGLNLNKIQKLDKDHNGLVCESLP